MTDSSLLEQNRETSQQKKVNKLLHLCLIIVMTSGPTFAVPIYIGIKVPELYSGKLASIVLKERKLPGGGIL